MTTCVLEASHDTDQVEELVYGPELLPIRLLNNGREFEAFLGVDPAGRPWPLPVVKTDEEHIVVLLDDKVRAFWRWYLLDRND